MNVYEECRHWIFALDPLHVGSGREHLTRIDLPHVREQGTGLPVIPGTSLAGVCRAYAYLQARAGKPAAAAAVAGANGGGGAGAPEAEEPICAGKGGADGMRHCGKCSICLAFGYSRRDDSRQGLAQIGTAHILYFPIATTEGPVWITCPQQLRAAGQHVADVPDENFHPSWQNAPAALRFGCLNLVRGTATQQAKAGIPAAGSPKAAITKVALVSDQLFCQLVSACLEVRTLVSIDPLTGAAAKNALFTYEAIPRGTLLWFDVVYLNPQLNPVDGSPNLNFDALKRVTNDGFGLMRFLGLGGMNTRGLGRAEVTAEAPAAPAQP